MSKERIKKKLIYFRNRTNFNDALEGDRIPGTSIVFIGDESNGNTQIYTHGKFFGHTDEEIKSLAQSLILDSGEIPIGEDYGNGIEITYPEYLDWEIIISDPDSAPDSIQSAIRKIEKNIVSLANGVIDNEEVIAAALTDLDNRLSSIPRDLDESLDEIYSKLDEVQENLIELTYSELVELKTSGNLVPGCFYRITDYVTTTAQDDTNIQSAGHRFDIVVTAEGNNILSEIAKACPHNWKEGETVDNNFNGSNLDSWEIKYCLENDTDRFAWADTENGKGVIYYLKDEKNNECYYDFKNIRFGLDIDESGTEVMEKVYYYTFSYVETNEGIPDQEPTIIDGTTSNQVSFCYGNKIEACHSQSDGIYKLNHIVFRNTDFSSECYSNIFNSDCYDNIFGDSCVSNVFGEGCHGNRFGSYIHRTSFGKQCIYNRITNQDDYYLTGCRLITFGDQCKYIDLWCMEDENRVNNPLDYWIQNISISNAVSGTDNNEDELSFIEVELFNDNRVLHITKSSSGDMVAYYDGDLTLTNVQAVDVEDSTETEIEEPTIATNNVSTWNYRGVSFSTSKSIIIIEGNDAILQPNNYYQIINFKDSLNISLVSNDSVTEVNEFFVEFTVEENTVITLPEGVKWLNGVYPTFEPNLTYQISIINNLGICNKYA